MDTCDAGFCFLGGELLLCVCGLALPYLRTALYGGLNCETPTGRPTLVWSVLLTRMYMSNHRIIFIVFKIREN